MNKQVDKSYGTGRAWVWTVLAILYSISPIDVVPDFLPVAGWADDILVLGTSVLNLLQAYTRDSNEALSAILKTLKYLVLFGGIIIVLILVLIAFWVYKAIV
ncbi:YkvA family protein [Segatella sp.]|uniref:YkvA family protein n=1 Tax=Segatella sp. TaxID=2974253 RepID=UPI003AB289C5